MAARETLLDRSLEFTPIATMAGYLLQSIGCSAQKRANGEKENMRLGKSFAAFAVIVASAAATVLVGGCISTSREIQEPAPIVQVPPPTIVQAPPPIMSPPVSTSDSTTTTWGNGAVVQKQTTNANGDGTTQQQTTTTWDNGSGVPSQTTVTTTTPSN
jgi:hypothetical protein